MTYQTVLLAVALQDWERSSESALAARDLASAVALGVGQQLHAMSVYRIPDSEAFDGLPHETVVRHNEEMVNRVRLETLQSLEAFVQPLEAAGITVEKHAVAGNPRELIVKLAEDLGADLLIIGSHSKRGLLDVALGGTARQVTSTASCPVAVAHAKP